MGIEPKLAVGDTQYGTVPNIVGLEERGIKAYLPTSDFSQRTKYYPAKLFQYDSEKDHYVCPQGQILPLTSRRKTEQVILYCAKASVCNACPVKSKCTGSKVDGIFSIHFSKRISTKQRVTNRPKRI